MKEQLKIYEEKMDKTIDSLMNDYASIRAGRANPHVLDKIWNSDPDPAGGKYLRA
jgi:ribosome recycling factor